MTQRVCEWRNVGWSLLGIVMLSGLRCQQAGQSLGRPWETISLEIKGAKLQVEVACDLDSRRLGLMRRETLGADEGMLFLFPETQELSFWMKDTLIPLSIAFLDDDGKIQEIAAMKPRDENHTQSKNPGKYALEVNQGWFQKHAIAAGDSIVGFRDKIGRFSVR